MSTNINKQKWPEPRPIEEAPTDGATVLCYFPWLGWEIHGFNGRFWHPDRYQPTHFLPLPPKPEVRK